MKVYAKRLYIVIIYLPWLENTYIFFEITHKIPTLLFDNYVCRQDIKLVSGWEKKNNVKNKIIDEIEDIKIWNVNGEQ